MSYQLVRPANPATVHGRAVVESRHAEYLEFHLIWRWLQDSLEGGERYREADYGYETYTTRWMTVNQETGEPDARLGWQSRTHQLPRRNLIRHPQEYPQGTGIYEAGPYSTEGEASTGDECEFRRALTPVPSFTSEAVGAHLSRIYAREV